MFDKIYGDIGYNDMLCFIPKDSMEYPVNRESYGGVFRHYNDATKEIAYQNSLLLSQIFGYRFKDFRYSFRNAINPSLVYDDGWKLQITPVSFFNSILSEAGSDDIITHKDKDLIIEKLNALKSNIASKSDEEFFDGINYYLRKNMIYCNLNKNNYIDFIDYSIKNIDSILAIPNLESDRLNNDSLPKDILYACSINALDIMERTNSSDLCVLPNYYYDRVSSVGSSPYAHKCYVNGIGYLGYNCFNDKYNSLKQSNPDLFSRSGNLMDNVTLLDTFALIRPGHADDKRITVSEVTKRNSYQMSEEEIAAVKDKIDFFESTPYKTKVAGLNRFDGYFGYVYDNDYLVFVKFYANKRESRGGQGNAIYVLPADLLDLSLSDKQHIINYIKNSGDDRAFRIIQRTERYKDRVNEVIEHDNVSKTPFDDIIETYNKKGRVLVK